MSASRRSACSLDAKAMVLVSTRTSPVSSISWVPEAATGGTAAAGGARCGLPGASAQSKTVVSTGLRVNFGSCHNRIARRSGVQPVTWV